MSSRGKMPLSSKYDYSTSVIVANSPLSPVLSRQTNAACISPDPANTVTDRLNAALNSSGPGFVLHLCRDAQYMIQAPILFAAPNQEISTLGYPTDNSRATLVVSGPVSNGQGHTTAIDGTCANCSGIILRNIQVRVPVPFLLSIDTLCLHHQCVIARSMELAPGLPQHSVEQI